MLFMSRFCGFFLSTHQKSSCTQIRDVRPWFTMCRCWKRILWCHQPTVWDYSVGKTSLKLDICYLQSVAEQVHTFVNRPFSTRGLWVLAKFPTHESSHCPEWRGRDKIVLGLKYRTSRATSEFVMLYYYYLYLHCSCVAHLIRENKKWSSSFWSAAVEGGVQSMLHPATWMRSQRLASRSETKSDLHFSA